MASRLEQFGDRLLGRAVKTAIRLLRRTNPDKVSDLCGAAARRIGPWFPAHRIGRANLRAAFPEKDDAWIEATLRDAWENLGRVAGEYVHMARIWDFDPEHPNTGRILTDDIGMFEALRDDGKPALIFAAHLGNWELPAIAAAAHGLPSAIVYRMPNNKAVAKEIIRIRAPLMGRLIRTRAQAALEMAGALQAGEHLGMLVDQHFSRGVDVTFFGRRCKANPAIARLARSVDCPVVGVRVVRLPEHRFRILASGPYALPRDAAGEVDVPAATQMITTIIEGWIREHPGQWLWFHRRWR
ncbi:lipid A biosynthesis lauroyl acyltransferase [Rhodopila sp.]|uniref:lipid A biosynthesis lauroyl acyltransferase n=1 Tax=Rhodopila sp. TaxID=2480087 RepID=UPI002C1B725B|nr:lipid A biosynthesis lauroyl acyltransferase [Rhodopila sp.]HVZ09469.1 lipid A biosynthesis lauroyl acyltransferase [Rhodopila sp.]